LWLQHDGFDNMVVRSGNDAEWFEDIWHWLKYRGDSFFCMLIYFRRMMFLAKQIFVSDVIWSVNEFGDVLLWTFLRSTSTLFFKHMCMRFLQQLQLKCLLAELHLFLEAGFFLDDVLGRF